jgi:hypothetical protein
MVGDGTAGPMMAFGYKQAWLAVRDTSADAVRAALGLRDLGPVSWRVGIDLAYLNDDRLALTPPLPGAGDTLWTLVVGRWLFGERAGGRPDGRADGRPGESIVDVAALSATLRSEVQLFASHRVVELHRWQRARDGALIRSFEYLGESGEVRDWRGDPDQTERAIGLPAVLEDDTDVIVGESDVMRVAATWSVNPQTLDGLAPPGPLHAAATP